MLGMVPRHPRKIDTASLRGRLAGEGFEASQRTIQRDLKSLSTCFPLVWDDRNKPYGWSWAKNAKVLDIPGMSPSVALAFNLAQTHLEPILPASTLNYLAPHFKRATEILRSVKKGNLGIWPDKVRILPRGVNLLPAEINAAVQENVNEALLNNKRFEAEYLPRDSGEVAKYEVNPLGLVYRHGVTYLVCTLWDYQDIKQLALHRMQKAHALMTKAKAPKGFDLDAYIQAGSFGYPVSDKTIRIKALFHEETAKHLVETPLSIEQKLKAQPDGRVLLEAEVPDTEDLRWWLLGFGEYVEVVAPKSLRQEFSQIAKSLSRIYK